MLKNYEKTEDVMELLEIIEEVFPSWSYWKGRNEPPPILIIDEANKFSQLGSSKEGEIVLVLFLDWLVKITKDKKFHTVLITSDSLFLDWITQSKIYLIIVFGSKIFPTYSHHLFIGSAAYSTRNPICCW